ncbi:MAG: purine-binding chemotaxis protein CheW [Rhodospirillaceae bacterium]|nr:MAG: purine-binding chemotaxis protein CheW [Rhodospirillaceae bacterium]
MSPSNAIEAHDATAAVLTLALNEAVFAFPIGQVREVLDPLPVTALPEGKDTAFVRGLVNVRGKVVSVADLHNQLALPPRPPTPDTRLVVLEVPVGGEPTLVAVVADRVFGVTTLSTLEEAPALGLPWPSAFVRTIGREGETLITLLALEPIFDPNSPEGVS